MEQENEKRAILYMTVSAFAGAVIAAAIKSLSAAMSPLLVFWLSRFFPLIGLIPMGLQGKLKQLATRFFARHLLLNFFYVSSIMLYFYSLAFISLVDASLLFNSAPLYAPVMATLVLKERTHHRLWWYVGLSFLGVILVLQPESSIFQPASLFAALSGPLMAAAQICNRHLARHESSARIVFYMIILAPFIGSIPVLVYPAIVEGAGLEQIGHWAVLGKLLLAGISTWLYQLYRTKSAAHGRIAIVMPFSYLGIVFAGFFDWLFWDVLPNSWTLLGIVLIFTGSFFIFRHSSRTMSKS